MASSLLSIDTAVADLKQGRIIGYPTESVYGLGCDPLNQMAVEKLLKIKQRDINKGLILVASDFSQLSDYLGDLSKVDLPMILASWSKRSITWLLPTADHTPVYLKGQYSTLAVRVSNHPIIQQLCTTFEGAIISTSANYAGYSPATSAIDVLSLFEQRISGVVKGELGNESKPSQIRDALTGYILR